MTPGGPQGGPAPASDLRPAITEAAARGPDGVEALRPPTLHLRGATGLVRAVTWFASIAAAVSVVELGLALLFADQGYVLGAGVAGGVAILLSVSRHRILAGDLATAFAIMSVGLFLGAAAYSITLPGSPAIPLVPLLVVLLALPYLSGTRLVQLAAISWLLGTILVALNSSLPGATREIPASLIVFRVFAFGAVSAAALGLVLIFSDRLVVSLEGERSVRAALEHANSDLKAADALKTTFMSSAAHELRTPLTPVLVQLHLLKSGKLGKVPPDHEKALGLIEKNLARLNLLVEDLLDSSRIQAGRLPLVTRRLDLNRLLVDSAESFHQAAEDAGLQLEVTTRPGLWVDGDPSRLMQVIFNLLTNAIKFTPRGGHISLTAASAGGSVTVRVIDTGAGVPRDSVDLLFQPFVQLDAPEKKARSGVGLGLFLSKGIVEAHGGRIWCESAGSGHGSTFAFSLPLAAAEK